MLLYINVISNRSGKIFTLYFCSLYFYLFFYVLFSPLIFIWMECVCWGGCFCFRFVFWFFFSWFGNYTLDFYFFRVTLKILTNIFTLIKYAFSLQYISFILSRNCNAIIILYISVYVHYFLTYHSVCICTFLLQSYFLFLK